MNRRAIAGGAAGAVIIGLVALNVGQTAATRTPGGDLDNVEIRTRKTFTIGLLMEELTAIRECAPVADPNEPGSFLASCAMTHDDESGRLLFRVPAAVTDQQLIDLVDNHAVDPDYGKDPPHPDRRTQAAIDGMNDAELRSFVGRLADRVHLLEK